MEELRRLSYQAARKHLLVLKLKSKMAEEIPDKNIFMMCKALNTAALIE